MSTSRLEKFIYAICSMEVSDLPAPLSRIEILWNCLITGETPDFEPQSRNEQYLMAMLGLYELENLPAPLSRGEKLLYKIAMGETDLSDIPAYLSRYEELLGYLAENGGVGNFEYILQTLNQRLSTLYSTKERPMKQAVIKGDTLVNELPRPSLKNTMTNTASQKMNHGYDNGKTLVNIVSSINQQTHNLNDFNLSSINKTKTYFIKFDADFEVSEIGFLINNCAWNVMRVISPRTRKGYVKLKPNEEEDITCLRIRFDGNTDDKYTPTVKKIVCVEYQDGMENWDIPYFEGTKTFSATPNVVDGEFKQAVVKGQTLVNIINYNKPQYNSVNTTKDNDTLTLTSTNNSEWSNSSYPLIGVTYEKKYRIMWDSITYTHTDTHGKEQIVGVYSIDSTTNTQVIMGISENDNSNYFDFTIPSNANLEKTVVRIHATTFTGKQGATTTVKGLKILEYQEGMENWDIPYFEGMQSVQLSEVKTNGGNNLVDKSLTVERWVDGSSGIDNSSEGCYIPIHVSGTIAISGYTPYNNNPTYIYQYDKNGKYLGRIPGSSEMLLKLNVNTEFIKVGFYKGTIDYINSLNIKVANQSNTLTLAEPVTLRKVGDVEDEFDALTGQVTERVGEVVLDGGNEYTWILNSSENTTTRFQSRNIPIPAELDDTKIPDVLCDTFKVVPNNTWRTDEEHVEIGRGEVLYEVNVRIAKTKLSSVTVDAFKEYLQSNPITLQYKLATESTKIVRTTITDQDGVTQTKLHSFNDGHLSVSSQGLLPSAVVYEVPTNNSYYLPDMLTLGAQYTSRGSADCNATIDGKLLALGKNRIFTMPSSVTDKLMVLDAPVDDLMFIKGDHTAKDFGYFEGMKSVEFSGVQVTGKNKFDGVSYIDGYIFGGGNTKVKPDSNVISILVNLEKNTDYIVSSKTSFDRGIVGGSMTPISINDYVDTIDCNKIGNTIRFNSGNYTYFIIYLNNGKIELTDLQVEKGSVVTPYEPYKSATLTLNEPVTLRKVGNVQDTLDGLTGEIVQNIGENVLDGVNQSYDSYSIHSANSNLRYIVGQVSNPCKFTGNYNRNTCVSDKISTDYGYAHLTDSDWGEGIALNGRHFKLVINLDRLSEDNLGGVKTYLSQNPITIQYELATPVVKTVDLTTVDQDGQPTKLKTFNDISYVEINADNIIPSVDVEVATKISETLAMLDPQHHDISNTQNELGQTIDEQAENTDATMMATTEIYEQTL